MSSSSSMSSARKRPPPTLLDVLFFVAANGFGDIVGRFGVGLCTFTRDDNWIWGHVINELHGDLNIEVERLRDGTERRSLNYDKAPLTRLMIYAKKGRLDLVQRAVMEYRANVNLVSKVVDPDPYGNPSSEVVLATPLMCAIEGGFDDIAEWLLSHKADPNQGRKKGLFQSITSPLDLAVEKGHLRIVKTLIETYGVELDGTELEMKDRKWCKPLYDTIMKQHNKIVTYLIRERGVQVNYPSNRDEGNLESYVSCAIWAGNWDAFMFLLEHGAVVNFRDYEMQTPLINAAGLEKLDYAFVLLQRGADPNFASGDWQNLTPLLAAARANNSEIAALIVQAGGNALAAITIDDLDDVDDSLEDGKTALHFFASHGNPTGVALVLQAGGEFDAVTFSGLTPLLICVKSLDKDASAESIDEAIRCCRLLVAAGANVNHIRVADGFFNNVEEESQEDRFTAATYAVERNAPALLSCLVQLGADITHCPDDNVTLLMRAARMASVECVKILLEAAVELLPADHLAFLGEHGSIENDDEDNLNAIGHCIQKLSQPPGVDDATRQDDKFVSIIQMLVEAGVPLRYPSVKSSHWPPMRAVSVGNMAVFQLLYEMRPPGADKSASDQDHRLDSAADLLREAVCHNRVDIAVYLFDKNRTLSSASKRVRTELRMRFFKTTSLSSLPLLCWSALKGNTAMCEVLCARTGDVNMGYDAMRRRDVKSKGGSRREKKRVIVTPLMMAVESGDDECIKCLLKAGASAMPARFVDMKVTKAWKTGQNTDSLTRIDVCSALGVAVRIGNAKHIGLMVDSVVESGRVEEALLSAVRANCVEIVKALISHPSASAALEEAEIPVDGSGSGSGNGGPPGASPLSEALRVATEIEAADIASLLRKRIGNQQPSTLERESPSY